MGFVGFVFLVVGFVGAVFVCWFCTCFGWVACFILVVVEFGEAFGFTGLI